MFNEYKNLLDFKQMLALIFLVKINRIIKIVGKCGYLYQTQHNHSYCN